MIRNLTQSNEKKKKIGRSGGFQHIVSLMVNHMKLIDTKQNKRKYGNEKLVKPI